VSGPRGSELPPRPDRRSAGDPINQYLIGSEPYYRPTGDEVKLFEAAYALRMPMMLKGPTGCGKTRFVEFMAWRLGKPLITIACHEDMIASDLVGRHLLDVSDTRWQDGPLTLAVRFGGICYLDEIVEARQDTTVVLHPLADARRLLISSGRRCAPSSRGCSSPCAPPATSASSSPRSRHTSHSSTPGCGGRFAAGRPLIEGRTYADRAVDRQCSLLRILGDLS